MSTTARLLILSAAAALLAACAQVPNSVTQTAQERSACAEIGLDPGSQAFAGCVGNLDANITYRMSAASH